MGKIQDRKKWHIGLCEFESFKTTASRTDEVKLDDIINNNHNNNNNNNEKTPIKSLYTICNIDFAPIKSNNPLNIKHYRKYLMQQDSNNHQVYHPHPELEMDFSQVEIFYLKIELQYHERRILFFICNLDEEHKYDGRYEHKTDDDDDNNDNKDDDDEEKNNNFGSRVWASIVRKNSENKGKKKDGNKIENEPKLNPMEEKIVNLTKQDEFWEPLHMIELSGSRVAKVGHKLIDSPVEYRFVAILEGKADSYRGLHFDAEHNRFVGNTDDFSIDIIKFWRTLHLSDLISFSSRFEAYWLIASIIFELFTFFVNVIITIQSEDSVPWYLRYLQ